MLFLESFLSILERWKFPSVFLGEKCFLYPEERDISLMFFLGKFSSILGRGKFSLFFFRNFALFSKIEIFVGMSTADADKQLVDSLSVPTALVEGSCRRQQSLLTLCRCRHQQNVDRCLPRNFFQGK